MQVQNRASRRLAFLYTSRFMAKQKVIRQLGQDVREHPTYSVPEASLYVHVPLSTLQSWVLGRPYPTISGMRRFKPLIKAADPERNLLSFYNVVEAHVLAATHDAKIPLKNVRSGMDYIEKTFPYVKHPLISYDFATKGKHLFIQHLGMTFDVTSPNQGQRVTDYLNEVLHKITKRGPDGYPIEIEPHNTTVLVINPQVCSGRPFLRRSGIPVAALWQRKEARQPIQQIAKDFGLNEDEVARAIDEFAA